MPYVTGGLYPLDAPSILADLEKEERFVFLETSRVMGEEDRSYLFRQPVAVLTASGPEDAPAFYRAVEKALAQGYYLAGWWAYEWGYALEPRLHGLLAKRRPSGPLVWLGVFQRPQVWTHSPSDPPAPFGPKPDVGVHLGPLELSVDRSGYLGAVASLKAYIAAGHTYQVNYTIKGRFCYTGRPKELYLALRAQQAVSYGAVVRDGDHWVLSLSPELFFRREGDRLWSMPMKGTMRRGRTTTEDAELARFLAQDPKNRAENVMIVDLLRNDVGRISRIGTIRVPSLFTVERYETLFQMTSRIEGHLVPRTDWASVFAALFPCGSVTGAPKIRTMEIIAEVEACARGVYTGSVGFLAPNGRAVLNVAIRTVVLHGNVAELGIGSGITIDSDAQAEYEECGLKATFLTRSRPDFSLVETLRWEPGDRQSGVMCEEWPIVNEGHIEMGYFLLERHLARLADSAHYFGFPCDLHAVRRTLGQVAGRFGSDGSARLVRLLLDRGGKVSCESFPVAPRFHQGPVKIGRSQSRVDSQDPFLFHKTTHRPLYKREHERAAALGLFDCLFVNERGELTEGAISNVFVRMDRELWTPPVACGLLNGTLRQELMAQGQVKERVLVPEELSRAEAVYVGNSVRGLVRAVLCDEL